MSCHLTSCYVLSYHVMTCHVISRLALLQKLDTYSHNMSCHLTSSHVLSRLVISCHVMSCHVLSCHVMSCHVMSCHVMSCHVMSCHLTSSHVLSYHVMSCHVTSCHVMSSHLASSHVLSRLVISCHLARESCSRVFLPSLLNSSIMAVGWPRRGFRNRGPVRESGSERCSRCGAARTASLRVWRRAHFWDLGIVLRGGLRGPGVLRACACGAVHIFATWASFCVAGCGDRACCERARVAPCTFLRPGHRFAWQAAGIGRVGGVSRACWRACRGAVPWGLGSGRVLYTHGQRAFRVAGCGNRACWECAGSVLAGRVGGAMPWGLGSGCVTRARDLTRCDLRFAWQVWDFGCIDALGKALDGGSAWQAQ